MISIALRGTCSAWPSAANSSASAALIRLRLREPDLRGSFRVGVGVPALVALALLPMLFIVAAVALEVRSRDIGLVGVLIAVLFGALGPVWYAARSRLPASRSGG